MNKKIALVFLAATIGAAAIVFTLAPLSFVL